MDRRFVLGGTMVRRFLLAGMLAVTASTQLQTADAQTVNPSYPRLGGYLISTPFDYDNAQYAAQIAKLNFAILNVYPGWAGSNGMTMNQAVTAIKAINPNIVVALYTDIMENPTPSGGAFGAVWTQLTNNTWWLYPTGSSGSLISAYTGDSATNITLYTPTNSSGQHYVDWRAQWNVSSFITPSPAVDGLYTDVVGWEPLYSGDYNRDGTTDSPSNPTVQTWWRQGYAQYFKDLKSQMSGKYQFGNVSTWGNPNATFPEFQGMLQGGVMEGMIGASWSYESTGWQYMMTAYRKIMAAVASPQLVIFEQYGSTTDYQSMRYGLTSCMMDNAYFQFVNGTTTSGVVWFDEYNAALGPATSNPSTTAYQNGVYRRDFQNGIALVNPKGNGTQTVTLETSYKHLTGTQDSSVNNGQTVTSVTLNDRDGVILLRTTAQSVPMAPTLNIQ
jgi:hypothetical protein